MLPAEELEAFARQPLESFVVLHYDSCVWEIARGWGIFLRYATMLARADRKAERPGAPRRHQGKPRRAPRTPSSPPR